MQMPDVKLHEPTALAEACGLLKQYADTARVLAGGTDLLVDLKADRVRGVEHLVSIQRIPGLRGIEHTDQGFRFGALVTPNQAARDERLQAKFPALVEAINGMAGYQVRNMATVVGNIASAVPSSDLAPFFIAADAEADLCGGERERRVALRGFFLGPRKTACRRDEIVTHIFVPNPRPHTGFSYQRFSLRGANALAVVGVAAMVRLGGRGEIADACVVLGAVAPVPDMAKKTNAFLVGRKPSPEVFAEAAKIARGEARPISDVRGTKEYRCELVETLTARALAEAAERAAKGGK